MRQLQLLSLWLGVFFSCAYSETVFIQPPNGNPNDGSILDDPVYKLGQTIELKWTADPGRMDLWIYQVWPPANRGEGKPIIKNTLARSLKWPANVEDIFDKKIEKGQDSVFYIADSDQGRRAEGITHYFNITIDDKPLAIPLGEPEVSTTKLAPSSTTLRTTTSKVSTSKASESIESSTPTFLKSGESTASVSAQETESTSSRTTGSTSNPTSTTQTTQAPPTGGTAAGSSYPHDDSQSGSEQGLSQGGVAGIAIAAVIGILLIFAGLGFVFWKRRRRGGATPIADEPKPIVFYNPDPDMDINIAELPAESRSGSRSGHANWEPQNPPVNRFGKPQGFVAELPAEIVELPADEFDQPAWSGSASGSVYVPPKNRKESTMFPGLYEVDHYK